MKTLLIALSAVLTLAVSPSQAKPMVSALSIGQSASFQLLDADHAIMAKKKGKKKHHKKAQ